MLLSLAKLHLYARHANGISMKRMGDFWRCRQDVAMLLLIIAGSSVQANSHRQRGEHTIAELWPDGYGSTVDPGMVNGRLIRVCVGSATVAGLTAASIIAPW